MATEGQRLKGAQLMVAALATLLWVATSLAVAGVVEMSAGVTAVNVGVPFLAFLFAYYVYVYERHRKWVRAVAGLLAVTGLVGLVAIVVQESTITFTANVLALLSMFNLVAFLWR